MQAHKTNKTFTLTGFQNQLLLPSCRIGSIIIIIVGFGVFMIIINARALHFLCTRHHGENNNLHNVDICMENGGRLIEIYPSAQGFVFNIFIIRCCDFFCWGFFLVQELFQLGRLK